MKLLAIVISYYPDVNDAISNILKYIEKIDKLVIWENTPLIDSSRYHINIPNYSHKIVYKSTGKNEGIAYPLNRIVEYALKASYTHLLTMDQDSKFLNFDLYYNSLLNFVDFYSIITPNINNQYLTDSSYNIINYGITSGTIYNINTVQKLGGFREDYFIDGVDTEFCFRAFKNQFQTIVINHAHLQQKFGCLKKMRYGFYSTNYSSFRTYYITRNYIFLWKEYPLYFEYWKFIKEYILKRFFKIIFLEQDKISKICSLGKGLFDGVFSKGLNKNGCFYINR